MEKGRYDESEFHGICGLFVSLKSIVLASGEWLLSQISNSNNSAPPPLWVSHPVQKNPNEKMLNTRFERRNEWLWKRWVLLEEALMRQILSVWFRCFEALEWMAGICERWKVPALDPHRLEVTGELIVGLFRIWNVYWQRKSNQAKKISSSGSSKVIKRWSRRLKWKFLKIRMYD